MLAYSLIDAIQAPLWMSITATGRIKGYSIWSSLLTVCNIPIAWLLLYAGYSPIMVFVARVVINFIAAVIRVLYVKSFLRFPIKSYIQMIIVRAIPVTMLAFGLSYYIDRLFADTVTSFIAEVGCIVFITCAIVFALGFSSIERTFAIQIIKSKILR